MFLTVLRHVRHMMLGQKKSVTYILEEKLQLTRLSSIFKKREKKSSEPTFLHAFEFSEDSICYQFSFSAIAGQTLESIFISPTQLINSPLFLTESLAATCQASTLVSGCLQFTGIPERFLRDKPTTLCTSLFLCLFIPLNMTQVFLSLWVCLH